jgi:phospholipid-binding lipoprotein MlaA
MKAGNTMKIPARFAVLTVAVVAATGCATANPDNASDPLEPFNRAMFTFNDKVDQVVLKPVSTAYQDYVPTFVQTAVGNFFGNIGDVWSTANEFMQGKVHNGLNGFMRVAVNTTLGLGGVLDVAGEAGLGRHNEDFGQTLGYWGVQSGPYIVLPLLGSSTVRDTTALPVDAGGNLWSYVSPNSTRIAGTVVRVVDQRAAVLGASNLLEAIALDKYQFVRDTYLQRRQSLIMDGVSQSDTMGTGQGGGGMLMR